jgi:integrase
VLLQKYSESATLLLRAHPHMLRHACGFALTDQGADTRLIQDYLGHRKAEQTELGLAEDCSSIRPATCTESRAAAVRPAQVASSR